MSATEGTSERMRPLFGRYQAGDRDAWNELVAHAADRLRRIARKELEDWGVFKNRMDIDHVVNEVYLRLNQAFKSGPGGRPGDVRGFFSLASKKMREFLTDMCRRDRKTPRPRAIPDQSDSATGPATHAERQDAQRRRHELVDRLSGREREVFELHFYQGLTHACIANEVLHVSTKTVERAWIKAVHKLHQWLSEEGLA
jgi:RNA polymerase sigma factor (sigma-70 family)